MTKPDAMSDIVRAPGSYRDPDGFVFFRDNRVFRALTSEGLASYRDFRRSPLCQWAEDGHWVTPTWETDAVCADDMAGLFPDVSGVIEQSRVPFVSYPYEWSFDMLKDAALHTLDLMLHGATHGFTLKDATAYNIQFVDGRPILIDILSLAKYIPGSPWMGYTQFCQQFLFPLALSAHKDIPFQPLLRSYLEGIPLHVMKPLLGGLGLRKAGMFQHVMLQSFLQNGFQSTLPPLKTSFQKLAFSLDHVTAMVRAMKKVVTSLHSRSRGHWVGYAETRSYTAPAIGAKQRFVDKHLEAMQPGTVWDLGCNTGEFALIAHKHAEQVIAMDADPDSVNHLYRHCRDARLQGMLPLVMDVTNPSPGLGWNNRARQSLLDRGKPTAVLMLAVLHHLCLTHNVPFGYIFHFLTGVDAQYVIIEFVPKSDPMIKMLLTNREDVFPWYHQAAFEAEAFQSFVPVDRLELSPGGRVVYCLQRYGS